MLFSSKFFRPVLPTNPVNTDAKMDFTLAKKELHVLLETMRTILDSNRHLLRYLQTFDQQEVAPQTISKKRKSETQEPYYDKFSKKELAQAKTVLEKYKILNTTIKKSLKTLANSKDITNEIIANVTAEIQQLLIEIRLLPKQIYFTPQDKFELKAELDITNLDTLVIDHAELLLNAEESHFIARCCEALSRGSKPLPQPANLRESLQGFMLFPDHFSSVMQKSRDEKFVNNQIPKKTHVIWVGSKLPPRYYENLISLCRRMPRYTINVWTFDDDLFRKVGIGTRKEFGENDPDMPDMALFHDLGFSQNPRIKIRNIRKELYPIIDTIFPENIASLIKHIIRLESMGNADFRNLSAASDLLRLIILLVEGGFYVDADTSAEKLPRISLQDFIKMPNEKLIKQNLLEALVLVINPDFRSKEAYNEIMKKFKEKFSSENSHLWVEFQQRMQAYKQFKQPSESVGFYVMSEDSSKINSAFMGSAVGHPMLYYCIAGYLLKYLRLWIQKPTIGPDDLEDDKLSGVTQVTLLDLKRINKSVIDDVDRRSLTLELGPNSIGDAVDTMKDENVCRISKSIKLPGMSHDSHNTWLDGEEGVRDKRMYSQDTLDLPPNLALRFSI